jgi:hypothetical protein
MMTPPSPTTSTHLTGPSLYMREGHIPAAPVSQKASNSSPLCSVYVIQGSCDREWKSKAMSSCSLGWAATEIIILLGCGGEVVLLCRCPRDNFGGKGSDMIIVPSMHGIGLDSTHYLRYGRDHLSDIPTSQTDQ